MANRFDNVPGLPQLYQQQSMVVDKPFIGTDVPKTPLKTPLDLYDKKLKDDKEKTTAVKTEMAKALEKNLVPKGIIKLNAFGHELDIKDNERYMNIVNEKYGHLYSSAMKKLATFDHSGAQTDMNDFITGINTDLDLKAIGDTETAFKAIEEKIKTNQYSPDELIEVEQKMKDYYEDRQSQKRSSLEVGQIQEKFDPITDLGIHMKKIEPNKKGSAGFNEQNKNQYVFNQDQEWTPLNRINDEFQSWWQGPKMQNKLSAYVTREQETFDLNRKQANSSVLKKMSKEDQLAFNNLANESERSDFLLNKLNSNPELKKTYLSAIKRGIFNTDYIDVEFPDPKDKTKKIKSIKEGETLSEVSLADIVKDPRSIMSKIANNRLKKEYNNYYKEAVGFFGTKEDISFNNINWYDTGTGGRYERDKKDTEILPQTAVTENNVFSDLFEVGSDGVVNFKAGKGSWIQGSNVLSDGIDPNTGQLTATGMKDPKLVQLKTYLDSNRSNIETTFNAYMRNKFTGSDVDYAKKLKDGGVDLTSFLMNVMQSSTDPMFDVKDRPLLEKFNTLTGLNLYSGIDKHSELLSAVLGTHTNQYTTQATTIDATNANDIHKQPINARVNAMFNTAIRQAEEGNLSLENVQIDNIPLTKGQTIPSNKEYNNVEFKKVKGSGGKEFIQVTAKYTKDDKTIGTVKFNQDPKDALSSRNIKSMVAEQIASIKNQLSKTNDSAEKMRLMNEYSQAVSMATYFVDNSIDKTIKWSNDAAAIQFKLNDPSTKKATIETDNDLYRALKDKTKEEADKIYTEKVINSQVPTIDKIGEDRYAYSWIDEFGNVQSTIKSKSNLTIAEVKAGGNNVTNKNKKEIVYPIQSGQNSALLLYVNDNDLLELGLTPIDLE